MTPSGPPPWPPVPRANPGSPLPATHVPPVPGSPAACTRPGIPCGSPARDPPGPMVPGSGHVPRSSPWRPVPCSPIEPPCRGHPCPRPGLLHATPSRAPVGRRPALTRFSPSYAPPHSPALAPPCRPAPRVPRAPPPIRAGPASPVPGYPLTRPRFPRLALGPSLTSMPR